VIRGGIAIAESPARVSRLRLGDEAMEVRFRAAV
jgi:cytosine deaminase